ncbi:MAG: ChaB family protein [Dehalococcoidia bacterium]|nr:ChaB family protein [Dehalococcoidia bacterium]
MPRGKKIDLPDTLKRSPKHAQEIYRETLQSAHETYEGDEERAHRAAYAAVKHSYKKSGDKWVEKDRKGPSDAQAARGPNSSPSSRESTKKTSGGRVDDEGQTKDELYERAKKLDVPGRSKMNKEELAVAVHEAGTTKR